MKKPSRLKLFVQLTFVLVDEYGVEELQAPPITVPRQGLASLGDRGIR